jgi:hypothetical protein
MSEHKIDLWGGIGEKKFGRTWSQDKRIYGIDGLSPTLSSSQSRYWIVIFDEEDK